jgi:hypothetical protein
MRFSGIELVMKWYHPVFGLVVHNKQFNQLTERAEDVAVSACTNPLFSTSREGTREGAVCVGVWHVDIFGMTDGGICGLHHPLPDPCVVAELAQLISGTW